ncbi:MAG: HEAT repeat domain-containing protein [Bacteroidales bacterium]
MEFQNLFNDKYLKPKEKTEILSNWLLTNAGNLNDLIDFAQKSKDSIKATCMEAIEFATKSKPEIATPQCLDFASKALSEKAPRIKWESARVIGNIAYLYPEKLDEAINNLIVNSEHPGTVVRWSAAYALSQIMKIQTSHKEELIPVIESIGNREEKNSIKKIYLDALKKVKI